jgi:hypothetical protein
MRRSYRVVWIAVCFAFLVGCGGDDDDDGDDVDAASSIDAAAGIDSSTTVDSGAMADVPSSVSCPDDYTSVEGMCDILLQDCPADEWCRVIESPTGQARCVPRGSGTVGLGGACVSGNNQCAPGLVCAQENCTAYCCPSTDQPCGGGTCDVLFWYDGPYYVWLCSF